MIGIKKYGLIFIAVIIGFISGYSFKTTDVIQNNHPDHLVDQGDSVSYVCPMHVHITSDTKDTCPICGMDLVIDSTKETKNANGNNVRISAAISSSIGVKPGKVILSDLILNVNTLGKITRLDSTARNIITTPIHGVISAIADIHEGDDVKQDDFLFSVTSDDLKLLAEEYQLSYHSDNKTLTLDLFTKLRNMGMTPDQIVKLESDEIVNPTINIYAEEDGYIFIRRGDVGTEVKPGYTVFNVGGNYQLAEITAEIFERQWARVKEDQAATMRLRNLPGIIFHGKVSRVEPPVGYTTRTLEIKLKFKVNDERISQSMFAHLSIMGTARKNLLLVPTAAVILTEDQQRVVKTNEKGEFQSVVIVAGEESMGMTEVISGLEEGDKIVTSGQFLIDSESQLLAAFNRMENPE
jgi:Cu(I)/Ag(I) efflux system membrane fusion protein